MKIEMLQCVSTRNLNLYNQIFITCVQTGDPFAVKSPRQENNDT